MKRCFGGESPWSMFLFVLLLLLIAVLASLLTFLWRLDLATSPAWQVGIYHVMLALLLSVTFVIASFPPLFLGQGLRWFLVGLVAAGVGCRVLRGLGSDRSLLRIQG